MSEMITHGFMNHLYCPACGDDNLRRKQDGRLICTKPGCADPDAAHKVLSDPEIHHIVRIDAMGYFNVKHPLIERVNDDLLECAVHDVVMQWVGVPTLARKVEIAGTVWRLKKTESDRVGNPFDWEMEQLA